MEGAGVAQTAALSPGLAGHVAAVLASLLVLSALLLMALLYVKCRLNVLLWYQDKYGEVEMNGAWGPDVGEGGLPRLSSAGGALQAQLWRALASAQYRKRGVPVQPRTARGGPRWVTVPWFQASTWNPALRTNPGDA